MRKMVLLGKRGEISRSSNKDKMNSFVVSSTRLKFFSPLLDVSDGFVVYSYGGTYARPLM